MAEYKRDYDSTGEYFETMNADIAHKALNHAENILDKVTLDLKRELETRFDRLETLIKDVAFTKKTTIWIIFISIASLIVMIIQLFKIH